ncbi:uncharacterized protein LOC116352043 [Contarinia nasturtii]|uniref:uncharacterized protein LOC116352043 n=1 Tax=Contarinia nasturtii TaxID=265458 RepID=UPI0012D476B3|nr:uncharacterized protein LOC116352043 [Contarinia nasturtii]
MELASVLKAMMLFMFNPKSDHPPISNHLNSFDASTESTSISSSSTPAIEIQHQDDVQIIDGNNKKMYEETTALVPYDFDCAMPYPPSVIERPTPPMIPSSKTFEENSRSVDRPHAKASFTVPIHIVHRLPDSAILDLQRFEDYCESKILDCYHAIRDFNNYNYEKNQEIQYLSYTDKRKQEIIQQSQEKKTAIEAAQNKMHQVCSRAERYREQITTTLNPYMQTFSSFFAQPKRVPKLWYDIHNLETIIQQLFTPKLKCRMHYVEKTKELRMSRQPMNDTDRKEFIPLPKEYINSRDGNDAETVNGANLIMEYNHPDTDIQIKKSSTTDQFNSNVLQQHTYSTNEEIQQIIIYYVFKFYELKVRDGTRKVFHYTRLLKQKKRSSATKEQISNVEDQLAEAIKELQSDTIEMERNRVTPELIGLYNAENEAKDLLPDTKFITKLIGPTNKRVITAFNPSESILFNALDGAKIDLIADESNTKNLAKVSASQSQSDREDLKEPLFWDQNWQWDF